MVVASAGPHMRIIYASLQTWPHQHLITIQATDSVTDLVNIEPEGNILQDAMLPS